MPDTPLFPVLPSNVKPAKTRLGQILKGQPPSVGGGQGTPQVQGTPGSPCLLSWPSTSLPLVGSVGGGCIISKTNVRAVLGGLMLASGASFGIFAAIVLIAAGFKHTGAGQKAGGALQKAGMAATAVGAPEVGAPMAAAGTAVKSGATKAAAQSQQKRRARQVKQEQRMERELGEPRENPNLRVGRGAVRETPAETRRRRESADRPPF